MVALAYDYRILILQIAQRSERRSKHRVCADKGMPAFGIKLRQSRLHRSYIGKNAFFADIRHHHAECLERILHRCGIDDQLRVEVGNLIRRRHSSHIISKTQTLRIGLKNRNRMLETQQIGEKRAHLSGSYNQYSHRHYRILLFNTSIC